MTPTNPKYSLPHSLPPASIPHIILRTSRRGRAYRTWCRRGRRRCGPGHGAAGAAGPVVRVAAGAAGPAGPGVGGRDKNTWWQQHAFEQPPFPECSAGTEPESSPESRAADPKVIQMNNQMDIHLR